MEDIESIESKIRHIQNKLTISHPTLTIPQCNQTFAPITGRLHNFTRLNSTPGKLFGLSWGGPGSSSNPEALSQIAVVSDTSELCIWNTMTLKPSFKVTILGTDEWLMSCAFEQSSGTVIASGGMEGKVWLHKLTLKKPSKLALVEHPRISFHAHNEYISEICFLSPMDLITVSGDSSVKLWNVEVCNTPVRELKEHSEDVMTVCNSTENPRIFITGGCDKLALLWDLRMKNYAIKFRDHDGHVNSIKFLHNSQHTFLTGSADGFVRVFDTRALRPIGNYNNRVSIRCVESSISGRLLLAGDQDGSLFVWDIYDERNFINHVRAHSANVTCLGLSPVGDMVASCSYDETLALWRPYSMSI